jgi:hypothetical protein
MACLAKTRNTLLPLDCEVESAIADAASSSLSAFQAAAQVLHKVGGVTALQIVTAAIDALRQQETRHQEEFDDLNRELNREISDLKDDVLAAKRAAAAIDANPHKSDRAIAADIGVGSETVRRARKSTAPHGAVDDLKIETGATPCP